MGQKINFVFGRVLAPVWEPQRGWAFGRYTEVWEGAEVMGRCRDLAMCGHPFTAGVEKAAG